MRLQYDLLTAGESPEYFYERLRGLDHEQGSVENILDIYEKVIQNRDVSSSHFFESLRNKETGQYPPSEIVGFILRCMLYKARGTYIELVQPQKEADVFKTIYHDIDVRYFANQADKNVKKNNIIVYKYPK